MKINNQAVIAISERNASGKTTLPKGDFPFELLYAKVEGKPLTWMDAIVNGQPVTPRYGMPIELNALWYNALCFAASQASLAGDRKAASKWKHLAELVGKSFMDYYWNDKLGYLADCIDGSHFDYSIHLKSSCARNRQAIN